MRPLLFLTLFVLIGAGCTQFHSTPTAEPTEGYGTPSPEGYISFREGFGSIPGPAPQIAQERTPKPKLSLSAELPTLPNEVTVVRRRATLPEPTFLQNITTALSIPAGALRLNPVAKELTIRWLDDQGYEWWYDATYARVSFERTEKPDEALTMSTIPDDARLITIAQAFLSERGIVSRTWGNPMLAFSWSSWWKEESRLGYCMTSQSLQSIRKLSESPYVTAFLLPTLPSDEDVSCSEPEFPARHVIQLGYNQDGLPVYNATGQEVVAAEIVVNARTQTVERGSFEIVKEADRSNYPAIDAQEAMNSIQRGGLNGFQNYQSTTEIDITEFRTVFYRHDANVNDHVRTFFVPALQAIGFINTTDGRQSPYSTIVPLVRSDSYR